MKFGRTVAVDQVSLQVFKGESLCVIGANGAGKTTLLYLLGGVAYPTRGHATVFGLDRWRDNFAIRKRSTFLTAESFFGESLTPYEYIRLIGQIYKVPKDEFVERIRRLADEMHMREHLNKPWEKLSLGMKKKTGLIAAFLPDAELRILDEPFAGGIDPLAMETLYRWMTAHKYKGETFVFSTQALEHAELGADRILLLKDGAVSAVGTPADLIQSAGVDPATPRALSRAFVALVGNELGP